MLQSIFVVLFWVWVIAGLAYWLGGAWFTRQMARAPRAAPGDPGAGDDAPPVVILVPARDEERGVEGCLRSLLAQDYPRLQVILADDGSTDSTRAIADRIAAADRRLTVIDPGEPPIGWIGKSWALHRAWAKAQETGAPGVSLLLFTDADVQFHRRAVSIAVRRLVEGDLDLVALLPRVTNESFWERTIMPAMIHGLLILGAISERFPHSDWPRMASGAFLLIPSRAYCEAGGHAALRGEIIEDIALATAVHRLRERTAAFHAPDLVWLRMYHGLASIWGGWAKNLFAGTQFRVRRAIESMLTLVAFSVLPAVLFPILVGAATAGLIAWQTAAGAGLLWSTMTMVRLAGNRLTGDRAVYVLLHPVAGLFLTTVFAASTWSSRFGRGSLWRGRRYK